MADEAKTATPNLDPAAVAAFLASYGGAEPKAAPEAKPAEAPDIREWLLNLEKRITEKDATDKATAAEAERAKLQGTIAKLVEAGDLSKVQDALAKLETFFTGKIAEKDQALSAVQTRLAETVRDTAIADATTGARWISSAAGKQALAILQARVEVATDTAGKPLVREKGTGRPAADVVKEALASDEFAHFLEPGHRGKGGTGGGHSAQASNRGNEGPPDLFDMIQAKIEAQRAEFARHGLAETVGFGPIATK